MRLAKLAILEKPMAPCDFAKRQVSCFDNLKQFRRLTVNKLRPQFNWHRHGWVLVSIDSSANTVSGFENYDLKPTGAKILGRGQTCRARANDQNICSLSGQRLKSRQPENLLPGAIFDRSPDIKKG